LIRIKDKKRIKYKKNFFLKKEIRWWFDEEGLRQENIYITPPLEILCLGF
jgi:hypothetical protein